MTTDDEVKFKENSPQTDASRGQRLLDNLNGIQWYLVKFREELRNESSQKNTSVTKSLDAAERSVADIIQILSDKAA